MHGGAFAIAPSTDPHRAPPPIPAWQKIALNLDEAADMIGVSRGHLEKFVANGELPVVHLGKSVRVIPATLVRFIADHEGATA